ncbi:MAG: IS630 family transposase [Deltaproteobacteria bacterium]|nr:IS630 family transposase [Deltaproteobacteria bacterium]
MARTGRPKAQLTLTEVERVALRRYTRRARTNRDLALRASIVLKCADGLSNTDVAKALHTGNATVGKWRRRFIEKRLDGLFERPRPGAPRKISDDQIEEVVVKTLETTPKGRTHWSTRKMAKHVGLSHSTISRVWRAFGLKPHRVETNFHLSNDPLLVEKVRDIVGLYMSPPENAVVVCIDEKSQIQALERAQPVLPMDLGQPEKQTSTYMRHGTLSLFAALNVATGGVIGRLRARHRAREFIAFLAEVDAAVEPGLDIHLVLDNLSTHKTPAVHRWLLKHSRFHLHFTPTHASWLNLVERFFGLLTEEALRRGSHASVIQLRSAILEYLQAHNEDPKPFRWTKTADHVLASIARFATRTLEAHKAE